MLKDEIKHLRLACAIPNPEDGTSYHRALGPLGAMARQDPRLELCLPQPARGLSRGWNLGWDWLAAADAVFLQRPYLPVHVQFCRQVKAMDLPLWIEWDDLLWDVPRSNSSHVAYADKRHVRECIEAMAALADVVSTATVPLAGSLGPKARVIPNAAHRKFYDESRQRRVAWRGSETHDEDMATVLPEISELARLPQLSRWEWHFSGGVPWPVLHAIPKAQFSESAGTGPVFFVPFLALLAPWVLFVPLAPSFFNRCKSNLAWIEATCAGAVVLGPDWEEWRRPGIVNYKSPADFKDKLAGLINEYRPELARHPLVDESREFIANHLRLEKVNELRWDVLNGLMGRGA